MKIAVAVHGTRGDVEPCLAVALDLRDRGHEVRFACPPNLVGFAEASGLSAVVAYGVDSDEQMQENAPQDWWKLKNPLTTVREGREYMTRGWSDMGAVLAGLADGADVILTGTTYQEIAANVAEHHGIALVTLHYFPMRPNRHILPFALPRQLIRPAFGVAEWVFWRAQKEAEDAQRSALGLPTTRINSVRRVVECATEIQAYDGRLFPGLNEEWCGKRPFVGSITREFVTESDEEVASWIAAGTRPIYFGFGSTPVRSPAEIVTMITSVCAELGERALISVGSWDLSDIPHADHVKLVKAVNYAAMFPLCRAVVHHGGAGTTAAGIRSGVPTLILWSVADQPIWAQQVKRLKIGASLRFSRITPGRLTATLRSILTPECLARARQIATEMTEPAMSITSAADIVEVAARRV
ncbi:glycosyltransferase [Mycobacterium sp. OTB74]|jgi:UDP:flavonoid glycosyltransferase YjiC (YdhE family)|uniref:glycosyltransferase n=1 Tax=Mycobacterium sp. OTB74 TaxID=1853452 RepID=UPI00247398A9|nr:glycosyltransferase [Mycobacterium sp. OTB74]MDH6247912.1 UDP:flavonoid glycosyltransferase YjiC (YdhE family) [Mycobacterium sp. OTB74]